MRIHHFVVLALVALVAAPRVVSAASPDDYFDLMVAELQRIASTPELRDAPSYMLAAAVLVTKQHPANPAYGDEKFLELAMQLGDVAVSQSERDDSQDRQDYEWEIHFWLDSYRLLESKLSDARRARWRKELERNVRWFAGQTDARIDFPRYQGPFIRTSTNHFALFASTVYLAGRVLKNKEWEELGTRAMHRLATEEQAPGGYWGEFTDNGPTTGYDYITMTCVALYYEHSLDTGALEALRRSTDFHKYFTWPNGEPVETINGRNRHWDVSAWGHFGFTHWPDGRRYAEFLSPFFTAGNVSGRDLGRLSQSALYYHEGPTAEIPQDLSRAVHQMPVPAGIRRTAPWTVCLSGLYDPPSSSQFTLDRQGNVSIYHDTLGMIITGANSKHQPELATFMENDGDEVATVPRSSRLRMSDEADRLGMAYRTFFVDLRVPRPEPERLTLHFQITEVGPNRMGDAHMNLQLVLESGKVLETAKTKVTLDENRIELGPEEIGGWIRHRGWTLTVDPTARLTWPIYPFNPYSNAPETELRHAVGRLSIPLKVEPQRDWALSWRRQEIAFTLETRMGGDSPRCCE
ncbi:MAG: hypothetical protein GEU99_06300 [Luteitalea sp.]|nr:hypothetical protein [Luteitalea sp.]